MTIETWLIYVGTVLVLMSTPGPSQLLMLSNSLSDGFEKSVFTAAGDLSANFIQMLVAAVGLAGMIASSQGFFVIVKWLGVMYLIFLGVRLLASQPESSMHLPSRGRSRRSLYWQGFVTSAANPKAIVFFAALFPQFIDPNEELAVQFAILSITYLTLDACFLCVYGKFADWMRTRLLPSIRMHMNRLSGAFLIGAAVLLGMKDVETR